MEAPFVIIRPFEHKLTDLPTSVCYYGGSGSGKTEFGGTAGDRTLIIDVGSSRRTLLSSGFRNRIKTNPIIVPVAEDIKKKGIPDTAKAYDKVCDVIDWFLANRAGDIDTIVIDDATFLRKAAMFKGLEYNQDTGKSQSMNKIDATGVMAVAVQDYGAEMSLIEQFIGGYNEIIKEKHGKNFILLAHERNVFEQPKDARGNPIIGALPTLIRTLPGFTGKTFPDQIPVFFDWVFHAEPINSVNRTIYRARTQHDGITLAKCRDSGVFATHEKDPNFVNMLKKAVESMK
jgi:hypothetical protein